jgi:hypothetical protein
MSMLSGLFGTSKGQHPNFERIAHALHSHLGLNTVSPPADVLAIIDEMTTRELLQFDNMQSAQGMQALFSAKSVFASVDAASSTVTLSLAPAEEIAAEAQTEQPQTPVLRLGAHRAAFHLEKPRDLMGVARAAASALAQPTKPAAPLPVAFEHLEAFERRTSQVMDLFVRYGRLNPADKDVLKKIRPTDSSLESRVTALERWQEEMTHRVRALIVPKATHRLVLGGGGGTPTATSEETLARRFDSLQLWMSKLIKALERTGVKFYNRPMWLPH